MDYSNTYDPNLAYPSTSGYGPDAGTNLAVVLVSFLFLFLFFIICYAVGAFLLSRIFKKAGVQQWIAYVPFYNAWKTLELGGQQGFWAVLAILPFVNIVSAIFMYIAMYNIGKKLGKEDWFILLAIFLPLVWVIWLGFDESKWNDGKKTVTTTTTTKRTKKAV